MCMFYVLKREKVDKQTDRAFSIEFSSFCLFSSLQRSFKTSHILALLFGHFSSIRFEIFSCVAHLYKYLSSAVKTVKTSRANNTPKVL